MVTERPLPGAGATTLGGGTAISGGGTPDRAGGTPFRPVWPFLIGCIKRCTPSDNHSARRSLPYICNSKSKIRSNYSHKFGGQAANDANNWWNNFESERSKTKLSGKENVHIVSGEKWIIYIKPKP